MKVLVMLKALQKYAGLKESPKDRCKDRNIGTWKGWNVELLRVMNVMKETKLIEQRTLRELHFIQLRVVAQYR